MYTVMSKYLHLMLFSVLYFTLWELKNYSTQIPNMYNIYMFFVLVRSDGVFIASLLGKSNASICKIRPCLECCRRQNLGHPNSGSHHFG